MSRLQLGERLCPLVDAGAKRWVEPYRGTTEEDAADRIREGPPQVK